MIQQISIFAENTKGAMKRITAVLSKNNININTLVTNDSAEYGIIRMIVYEPEKTKEALLSEGYLCRMDKVIAVEMADSYGSLDRLLDDIEASNINLDYIYISYDRERATPIAIMHSQGASEVEECLRGKGYRCLDRLSE